MAVHFFSEEVIFVLPKKRVFKKWILDVALTEQKVIGEINYIFTNDTYLLDVNKKYLNHDYFTDIITFDNCEGNILNGDIFISIDTVKTNAIQYNVSFDDELKRVIVHGVLHLIGYDDKNEDSQNAMRSKENQFLLLANSKFFIN